MSLLLKYATNAVIKCHTVQILLLTRRKYFQFLNSNYVPRRLFMKFFIVSSWILFFIFFWICDELIYISYTYYRWREFSPRGYSIYWLKKIFSNRWTSKLDNLGRPSMEIGVIVWQRMHSCCGITHIQYKNSILRKIDLWTFLLPPKAAESTLKWEKMG